MSNRKESLKKTLGITEYPWSSDDDDNDAVTDVHLLRRQSNEPRPSIADMPGTSGAGIQLSPSSPPPTTTRKNQAKMDRDLFWSLINNPHKVSSVGSSRSRVSDLPLSLSYVSRPLSHPPPSERDLSSERASPNPDIQRILAFKKLTRNLNVMRPKAPAPMYSMSSRSCAPSRNPLFTPSISSSTAPTVRQSRSHGSINKRSYYTSLLDKNDTSPWADFSPIEAPQASTSGLSREHAQPSTSVIMSNVNPQPAQHNRNTQVTDDETESPTTEAVEAAGESQNDNADDEHMDVDEIRNASGDGVSLEEEIVEIDASDEQNAAADNAEQSADKKKTDGAIESTDQPHSMKRKREGHEENSEPYTVKQFNQSLLRLLECPVCLEWMEPPMSQCRRGHLVCGRCRARLASCPVCRTTFSSVRNRAMEGVAEMLRYPCRHGCGREVRLRRRAPHEASCASRRYHCPASPCADRPPLPHADLAHHCQTKHVSMVKTGRRHKFSMKVNAEQHDSWVIMTLHEMFHLRVDVDIRTWSVIVYVAYIGPKCNAPNYTYEVTIVGQHNSRKLVYQRAAHSDLESSSLNVNRQDCFYLNLDQALNFLRFKNRHCESDKYLDFDVEISKNEIEVPKEDSDS